MAGHRRRRSAPRPAARPTDRFRWGQLARAPRAVWLVTVAFTLLLAASTVLYPPYRGPDEPKHVDLVIALDHGATPLWDPLSRQLSAGVEAGELLSNGRIGDPQRLADRDLPPRSERESYTDAGGDVPSESPNQLVQHPPLYYLLLAGVLQLVPDWEDQPFDRVVGVLRFAGLLPLVGLPLLAHAVAARVSRSPVAGVAAAVLVTGVPQLVHIGAGVNNDNLQNALAGLATVLLAYVATGDLSRRTAVAAGAVVGLALLTKGLMLVFVPLLVLAYALGWRRDRLRDGVVSALLATGVAFVVGGWWWLRNVVEFGRVQPNGQARSTEVVRGWGPEAWGWLGDFGLFVTIRYWFDHPSGSSTGISIGWAFGVTAAVAALLVVALLTRPGADAPRRVLLLVLAPMPLLLVVLLSGSWESFTFGRDEPALQGRYLFGGLVGVCAVTAVGLARWLRGARPAAVLVPVLAWCGLAQALAAFTALRLYWWPADNSLRTLVDGLVEVPPWPGPVGPVLLAGAAVAAVVAAVDVLRCVPDAERGPARRSA